MHSGDVHERSARRISARKKEPLFIDSSFFKRPYKKSNVETLEANKQQKCQIDINVCKPRPYKELENLSKKIFQIIPQQRRQRKAIESFRIKKLKKLFAENNSLKISDKNIDFTIRKLLYTKSSIIQTPNAERTLRTLSRFRDTIGRFHNSGLTDKQASADHCKQSIEEWNVENRTTAAESTQEYSDLGILSHSSTMTRFYDGRTYRHPNEVQSYICNLYDKDYLGYQIIPTAFSAVNYEEKGANSLSSNNPLNCVEPISDFQENLCSHKLWDSCSEDFNTTEL